MLHQYYNTLICYWLVEYNIGFITFKMFKIISLAAVHYYLLCLVGIFNPSWVFFSHKGISQHAHI